MKLPAPSSQRPRASLRGAGPFAGWVIAAVTVAGCGGSAAPQAQGGAALDPLAAAEADLAAAEAKLGPRFGLRANEAPRGPGLGGEDVNPGTTVNEPPQPSPPPPAGLEAHKAEPETTNADSCETACDALSAMRKAADRICDLAPGERCDAARARVADAEKRVTEACSECEG